ncbi:MAG: hypothetical protein IKI57_07210 [Clostridia bacterium]|nr:hypothetical protein [Clostridia bacterium]
MYKIVRIIGIIIRSQFLANAFEFYFGKDGMGLLYAYIINATIGEALLYMTSFSLVGTFYEKNSFPTVGSLSYTAFYILNNCILIASCLLCRYFNLHIAISIVIYTIIEMILYYLFFKINNKSYFTN